MSQCDIKYQLTRVSLVRESIPEKTKILIFVGMFPLMLVGIQSYIFIFFLTIFFDNNTSFLAIFFGQLICTLIVLLGRKIYGRPKGWKPENGLIKLDELQEIDLDFCFWPHFFQKLSPRTHEWLAGIYVLPKRGFILTFLVIAAATFPRIFLQQYWIHSLIHIATNFRPDPAGDLIAFLLSSAMLAILYIWSLTPEFLPGSEACSLLLESEKEIPKSDEKIIPNKDLVTTRSELTPTTNTTAAAAL
ncbi:MAG: hypothetical protein HQM10_24010 [Candidatus Riflebacteria bacterium]|nr:hypothetical protein [Candidatus Riflebacteria bacterium]